MPCNGDTFNEKSVPPWTRGDFRGVLDVTHNLVWVVDRGTHPGAPRWREVFSRLHLRATPATATEGFSGERRRFLVVSATTSPPWTTETIEGGRS